MALLIAASMSMSNHSEGCLRVEPVSLPLLASSKIVSAREVSDGGRTGPNLGGGVWGGESWSSSEGWSEDDWLEDGEE